VLTNENFELSSPCENVSLMFDISKLRICFLPLLTPQTDEFTTIQKVNISEEIRWLTPFVNSTIEGWTLNRQFVFLKTQALIHAKTLGPIPFPEPQIGITDILQTVCDRPSRSDGPCDSSTPSCGRPPLLLHRIPEPALTKSNNSRNIGSGCDHPVRCL
jgi:hypothetical protein